MKIPKFSDKILYVLNHEPGGVDGMDTFAKGGPVEYSFNPYYFEQRLKDSRFFLTKEIISPKDVEKLIENIDPKLLFLISEVARGNLTARGGNLREII